MHRLPLLVTPVIGAMLVLCLAALGLRVSQLRWRLKVVYGDGGNNVLRATQRAHGNLAEHLPGLLLLLLVWELLGGPREALWAVGVILIIGRGLHAASFLIGEARFRLAGAAITYLSEITLAVAVLVQLYVGHASHAPLHVHHR